MNQTRSQPFSSSDAGYEFDVCYTSVLKRAIRTLWLCLDSIDQMWLPVHRTWRLNERHYGGLTGLNKSETAAKHGEAQVKIWRRSFDIPPPSMDPGHDFYTIISKVRDTQTRIHIHSLLWIRICLIYNIRQQNINISLSQLTHIGKSL